MRHRLHRPVDPYLMHNKRVVFHMDFMEMQVAQNAFFQRELNNTLIDIERQLDRLVEKLRDIARK